MDNFAMRRKKVIHRLWTEEEFEIMADMVKKGSTQRAIAERLNRSYVSIHRKIYDMRNDIWDKSRWSKHISIRSFNYWTYEELREAKLILDCGGTLAEAAKKTSHSGGTLGNKIITMGSDFWEERNWDRYVVG